MDLNGIIQLARSQGPVFWIATVAIALGATLLVVALIQVLRRALAVRLVAARQVRIIDAAKTESTSVTEPDVYVPSQPAAVAAAPPSIRSGFADNAADQSMALLLRRLQSAGDRLEEIAGDLRGDFSDANDSGLKEDLQDVEYVFRASGP